MQHYYAASNTDTSRKTTIGNTQIPVATRNIGHAILLVAPDEIDTIVWLKKDGEKILWRENDDLINGERFFAMEQLCYPNSITQSVSKRALAVFDHLAHIYPELSEDELAQAMGYTASAIKRIKAAELS